MARILALSSHVVRGNVGLAVAVPALQSLGHEVWALPTISLASRPGLGRASIAPGGRRPTEASELAAMLAALEGDGGWPLLDAVLLGYFASADAVAVAADVLARIKAANPRVRVLVDPILGDGGRLYISEDTARAIRARLLPLADIATPNRFELAWLTGADTAGDPKICAGALGPATVVVTSARETDREVTTLLVTGAGAREFSGARLHNVPNGSGDLLDGLFLGHLLQGKGDLEALGGALDTLSRILAASAGKDVLDLKGLFDRH